MTDTKTTPIELALCPFCGGEAYIVKSYGDWYAGCNCKAEPGCQDYVKENAVELWNTRPLEQQAYQRGHAEGVREQKEKDAVIVEERGEGVGGGLDPELTAKAIREASDQ